MRTSRCDAAVPCPAGGGEPQQPAAEPVIEIRAAHGAGYGQQVETASSGVQANTQPGRAEHRRIKSPVDADAAGAGA